MRKLWMAVFLMAGITAVEAGKTKVPTPDATEDLKLFSFNVLGYKFADPKYYPGVSADLLERAYRRDRIIDMINDQKIAGVHGVAMEEVFETELPFLMSAWGDQFVAQWTPHSPTYWAKYFDASNPWEANGNLLLLRKDAFKNVTFGALSSADGNTVVTARCQLKNASSSWLTFYAAHYDSDQGGNRKTEAKTTMGAVNQYPGDTHVLMGDMNFETDQGALRNVLMTGGFRDVMDDVGLGSERTHPFTSNYNHNNTTVIDHFMIKGGRALNGTVFNNGVWIRYPIVTPDANEVPRIEDNLRYCGSDHFAIGSTVRVPLL